MYLNGLKLILSQDEYEYHLFFLDTSNRIWGIVSDDPEDMWKISAESALEGNYTAASYSKLASYGRQCGGNCGNATSIVIWQSENNTIWLAGYQPGSGWQSFANDADLDSSPVQGTSISTVSLGADEGLMSIYVNTGRPTELHFNRTDGWASNGGYLPRINIRAYVNTNGTGACRHSRRNHRPRCSPGGIDNKLRHRKFRDCGGQRDCHQTGVFRWRFSLAEWEPRYLVVE